MCSKSYLHFVSAFDAELGEDERSRLFSALAKIYLLSDEDARALYSTLESAPVREIETEEQYLQHMRLIQLSKMNKCALKISKEELEALSLKVEAMSDMREANLIDERRKLFLSNMTERLTSAARSGGVLAMFMTAVMLKEGIIVDKNDAEASKIISKLANWTDVDGLLLAIRYDGKSVDRHLNSLFTVTKGLPEERVYKLFKVAFNKQGEQENDTIRMLVKATQKSVVDKNKVNPAIFRICTSDILSLKDKTRVVMNSEPYVKDEIAVLPLRLSPKATEIKLSRPIVTPLNRVEEQKRVEKFLTSDKFADVSGLLICADDAYLLSSYLKAIEESAGDCNVTHIDLDDIKKDDFSPARCNVILRSINESKQNLFLVTAKSEAGKEALEGFASYVDKDALKRFKIADLNVELDLSAIKVVMFADAKTKRRLQKQVMTLPLDPITEEERRFVIERLAGVYSRRYGVDVTLSEEILDKFKALKIESADELMQRALQNACLNGDLSASEQTFEEAKEQLFGSTKKLGFGGNYDERI